MHLGVHFTWIHREETQTNWVELRGKRSCKMILRGFCNSIRTPPGIRTDSGIRADEEEEPSLSQHHGSCEHLRQTKRTDQIHCEDTLEVLTFRVEQERHR